MRRRERKIRLRTNSQTAYFRLGTALLSILRRTEHSPLVSQSLTRGAETEVFSKLLRDLFRVGKARAKVFPLPSPPHFDSFYAPHFTQGTTTRAGLSLSPPNKLGAFSNFPALFPFQTEKCPIVYLAVTQ